MSDDREGKLIPLPIEELVNRSFLLPIEKDGMRQSVLKRYISYRSSSLLQHGILCRLTPFPPRIDGRTTPADYIMVHRKTYLSILTIMQSVRFPAKETSTYSILRSKALHWQALLHFVLAFCETTFCSLTFFEQFRSERIRT